MSAHGPSAEKDAPVEYEVWRSGPNLKARDVRLYRDLDEQGAQETLALCYADKAEAYPDAAIEFYLMRVSRTRVFPPAEGETAADELIRLTEDMGLYGDIPPERGQ